MVNYGVIGTSWITESFIQATKNVDGLNLTAVYSRTKEKADEFALKYGVSETFTNLEEMATSETIDAVYIASPNSLHYEQSKLFLKQKKHVICEKPIAISGKLVAELFELAKENNVIFMEALKGIHLPQQKLLVEAMKKIGRITAAKFDFCQLSSKYPALKNGNLPNIFNPDFKTGCVMDIGIYCVYPALYLFGKYNKLSAHALKHANGIDLCGGAILNYDDKVVTLTYSKLGDGRGVSEIIGDNGTITIKKLSDLEGITLHHTDSTTEVIHTVDDSVLSMQFEAESFYNYITNFSEFKAQYEELSELCVAVSDTLKAIRNQCEMEF
ncbi:MAG: Gfo/Idh/MocA family oxidoreductase [Oscillospiraceae bacterium]